MLNNRVLRGKGEGEGRTLVLQLLSRLAAKDGDLGVVPLKHERAEQRTRRRAVAVAH